MTIRVILGILLCTTRCSGGFERMECGARPRALGGAWAAMTGDVWCQLYNPAGLSAGTSSVISWYASPSPFSLSELSVMAGAFRIPLGPGSAGASVIRFGYEAYRELTFTAGYGLQMRRAGVGISASMHTVSITGYGSAHTLALNLGAQAQVSRSVAAGIAVFNCTGATIGASADPIPRSTAAGIAYRPSGSVLLLFEWYREPPFDPAVRAGFEFHPVEPLSIRGGASDIPAVYSAGCGLAWDVFGLDYALLVHGELGWTHEISVTIGRREP